MCVCGWVCSSGRRGGTAQGAELSHGENKAHIEHEGGREVPRSELEQKETEP